MKRLLVCSGQMSNGRRSTKVIPTQRYLLYMRGKEDLKKIVGGNPRIDHSLRIIERTKNVTSVISLDISGRIILFRRQKKKLQAQVVPMYLKAAGKDILVISDECVDWDHT